MNKRNTYYLEEVQNSFFNVIKDDLSSGEGVYDNSRTGSNENLQNMITLLGHEDKNLSLEDMVMLRKYVLDIFLFDDD
jgi:hypothetical protein